MKHAAIYMRVSTDFQEREGNSLPAQKERLAAYAKAMNFTVYREYVDGGFSGAKINRPALNEMISDIEAGLIDVVIVYKLDRLSRSQKHTMYLIEDVFLKHQVDFISIQESFDTSSSFGRAMIGILSVFAQLERDNIRERTLLGRTERAKKGYYRGGNNIPTGYYYKDNELLIDEQMAPFIQTVFEDFVIHNKPAYQIYKEQYLIYGKKVYGPNFIRRILSNDVYIGNNTFSGKTYQGRHRPIISKDIFDLAQEKLSAIPEKYKVDKTKRASMLARKLFCGNCGASIVKLNHYPVNRKIGDPPKWSYYVCNSHRKSRPSGVKDPNCPQKNYRVEVIDKRVLDALKKIDVKEKIEKINVPPDETAEKLKKIKNLEKQASRLLDLYQIGGIDIEEYKKRNEKLNSKKHQLTKKTNQRKSKTRIKLLSRFIDFDWDSATFEELCEAVDSLVKKITLTGDNLEIELYD